MTSLLRCFLRCFLPSHPPPPASSPPHNIYKSNSESESCAICLEQLVQGDETRVLNKCMHMFHKDCIDEWLPKRSVMCPICRTCAVDYEVRTNVRRRASCGRLDAAYFPANLRVAHYL